MFCILCLLNYNNFGTYILRTYHQHPEYFKNSYNFVHNVIPGFYIKNTGGLGSMAYINSSQLRINFKYDYNGEDGNKHILKIAAEIKISTAISF